MSYSSINGKVVNGKFVHTRRNPPAGYRRLSEDQVQDLGSRMLNNYKNPFSTVNKMTAQLRANKVHCMKDDLDHGADIYELARNSMFVKA